MTIRYGWRDAFDNAAANALHAEAFNHRILDDDWLAQLERHSLGWVCAWDGDELVGFVNVAWDGAVHAFILDTIVAAKAQRRGIATALVARAVDEFASGGLRVASRRLRRSPARSLFRCLWLRPDERRLDPAGLRVPDRRRISRA